jgi:hypothetical protein
MGKVTSPHDLIHAAVVSHPDAKRIREEAP